MRYVPVLIVLLVTVGWAAAEVDVGGSYRPREPQWRRTNEGWIKVGSTGLIALDGRNRQSAGDPTLHPAVVAGFVLLAGVLALVIFDRHGNTRDDRFLVCTQATFRPKSSLPRDRQPSQVPG